MLLEETVKIHISSANFKYWYSKGYDIKYGDDVDVLVEHLSYGTHTKVHVKCDYCGSEDNWVSYYSYLKGLAKLPKYACKKCKSVKEQEVTMMKYGVRSTLLLPNVREKIATTLNEKYGVSSVGKIPSVQEKKKQTFIEKYGCENPMQDEHMKTRARATNLERYGYEFPVFNKEVSNKMKKTCMEKYGNEYAIASKDTMEKIKNVIFEKYGCENPMQNKEIALKARTTLYQNSSVNTSRQQKYLHKLYGGELNYPLDFYSLDIYLKEEGIAIEYDGGGHDLSVKLGNISREEFDKRKIMREKYIRKHNIKIITIISQDDKLPCDKILLLMLNMAKRYFTETNHTWYEFNIDTSSIRNYENLEGVFFDYGKLYDTRKLEVA